MKRIYRIARIWYCGKLPLAKKIKKAVIANRIWRLVSLLHDKMFDDMLVYGESQIKEKDFEDAINAAQNKYLKIRSN